VSHEIKSTTKEISKTTNSVFTKFSGLKKFSLDFPVDDNFARGVLLQMKPLDLLTLPYSRARKHIFKNNKFQADQLSLIIDKSITIFCLSQLSISVFSKVIQRHKSFCSISDPA